MKTEAQINAEVKQMLLAITGLPEDHIDYVMSDEWELVLPFIYADEETITMAKAMAGKGGFGKAHGGANNINSKLVVSPMAPKMAPKGGKVSGKR